MDEAAIYLRLSKEDIQKEGENSESINNQRLLLTNFCLEKGFPIKKSIQMMIIPGYTTTGPDLMS